MPTLKYSTLCYTACRVQQAKREDTPIVDIDGSYAYKKFKGLVKEGKHVVMPSHPSPPLSGWRAVNKDSYLRVGPMIPTVTSGILLLVVYLNCDVLLMLYFYLHNGECLGSANNMCL